jgi:multiple sugar transport system permease protein
VASVAAAYAMVILGISVAFTILILRLLLVPKEARL